MNETAPTETAGSILDGGQEAKTEILVKVNEFMETLDEALEFAGQQVAQGK